MSIFDQNKDEQPNVESYQELLVGEDKKYKSTEDVSKAYYNLDIHKQKLEEENKILREKLESADNVEKVAEENKKKDEVIKQERQNPEQPNLSEEQLDQLIQKRIERTEKEKAYTSNIQMVDAKLTEKFGSAENAQRELAVKAAELGVTIEYLGQQAALAPQMVLQMFGEKQTTVTSTNFKSTTSPEALDTFKGGEVKGKSYYQKLLMTDPKAYYSKRIQNEMSTARANLGSKYNDF